MERTIEEYRMSTLEFSDNTKVKDIPCFIMFGECLINKTKKLENIKNTMVGLHPEESIEYFWGNFIHRTKFEKLVDPWMIFLMMIHAMLLTLGFGEVAEKLLENKDAVKQYFQQQNWTNEEMTAQCWFTDLNNRKRFG